MNPFLQSSSVIILSIFLTFVFCADANSTECLPLDSSPIALQGSADWIIEANVMTVFAPDNSNKIELILEKAKVVQADSEQPKATTISMGIDPCYLGNQKVFHGRANALALVGKNMRFYGRTFSDSPRRRFFYMEPVSKPLRIEVAPTKTNVHRVQTENILPNGWNLAQSTDGRFSVELPGPFNDATVKEDSEPTFLLASSDSNGAKFIALFERAGPRANMGKKFDSDLQKVDGTVTKFRGFPALLSRAPISGSDGKWVSTSLRFRVPEGIYMLSISSTTENESDALKEKEHFFNSIILRN